MFFLCGTDLKKTAAPWAKAQPAGRPARPQPRARQAPGASAPGRRLSLEPSPSGTLATVAPPLSFVSFSFSYSISCPLPQVNPPPHLYKYPHTPPLNPSNQTPSPTPPRASPSRAPPRAPHPRRRRPAPNAAALVHHRRRPTPPFTGAPRRNLAEVAAPRLSFSLGSVFLINRFDSFLLF